VTSDDQQRGRIESEATDWLVLQTAGGLDSRAESAFETWIGRSAQHRAVYDELRRTWDSLEVLQSNPGDLLRHTALLHRRAQIIRRPRRLAAALTALAATLLLVALGATIWLGDLATLMLADHRSAPGELRSVTLADGSHVDLGPASAIRVQFSATERRIELLNGSAFFHAVPQALAGGRPFVVETGRLSARALGTRFAVERLADRDTVAVAEHDVEVTLRGLDRAQSAVLSSGQTLRYRHGAALGVVGSIDPREIAAWRSGNLVFYQAPLGEVVAELNRYRRSRIAIMDDELAARVVSGVVRGDDPDGALKVVTDELRVRKTESPFFVIIHK
jgi:transmembrane sensor